MMSFNCEAIVILSSTSIWFIYFWPWQLSAFAEKIINDWQFLVQYFVKVNNNIKCLFSGSYHNVYIHMIFQGQEFKEPVG